MKPRRLAVGRLRTGAGALTLSALLLTALSACTLPDVTMSPGLSHLSNPSPASPTHAALPPAPPIYAAAPVRPSGDLDSGSVTHQLPAGDRTVVIDYWTTQDAKSWDAESAKTIQLSAHIEGGNPNLTVKVTRFLVTADDGTARTTAAEDRGEFVITPPFSYATAVNVPPSSPSASTLTLYVQFDLLVETGARSQEFFRQTVLDTLSLPLLQKDKK